MAKTKSKKIDQNKLLIPLVFGLIFGGALTVLFYFGVSSPGLTLIVILSVLLNMLIVKKVGLDPVYSALLFSLGFSIWTFFGFIVLFSNFTESLDAFNRLVVQELAINFIATFIPGVLAGLAVHHFQKK